MRVNFSVIKPEAVYVQPSCFLLEEDFSMALCEGSQNNFNINEGGDIILGDENY